METPVNRARARRRSGLSRITGVTVGVAAAGGVGSLLVAAGLAVSHADTVAATVPAGTGSTGASSTTGAADNVPTNSAPAAVPGKGNSAAKPQQQQPQQGQGQVAPGGGGQPQAQSQGS